MIWWQDLLTNAWSPGKLITWQRGFACISPGEGLEPVWIPAHRVNLSRNNQSTPDNLIMVMFALITITVSTSLALAEAKNYTYWAYIPKPSLLKPIDWGYSMIPVYVNDSTWIPGPEDTRLPLV